MAALRHGLQRSRRCPILGAQRHALLYPHTRTDLSVHRRGDGLRQRAEHHPTGIPMLVIANAYRRLNMWNVNCGASFEWAGRSINPYLGFMTG